MRAPASPPLSWPCVSSLRCCPSSSQTFRTPLPLHHPKHHQILPPTPSLWIPPHVSRLDWNPGSRPPLCAIYSSAQHQASAGLASLANLPESVLTHIQTRPPRRIPQHLIPSVIRKNGKWPHGATHPSNKDHANAGYHRRNQGTFTATRSLNHLQSSSQPRPAIGPHASPPQLTLTLQCFRPPRLHHCIQRPQARQEHQVDHLQDLRRLQGDCC